jgi:succinate dehydrogenase / fumarate reductase, membrane anchor subunit
MMAVKETVTQTALQSPLGRVRGLGSAKGGTHHWWMQRVTSIALLPLTIWFVFSAVGLAGLGYAETRAWIGAPVNAVLLLSLIGLTFHHMASGLQVVIEDYTRGEFARMAMVLAIKAASLLMALAAGLAVLRIALSS